MKIRSGFVSNSSSSSFVCDISGRATAGRDDEGYEEECCNCANGHSFYSRYLLVGDEVHKRMTVKEKRAEIDNEYEECVDGIKAFFNTSVQKELDKKLDNATDEQINALHIQLLESNMLLSWVNDWVYGTEHCVVSVRCPICQLQELPDKIALKYLMIKLYANDEDKLFEEIKKEFGNFDKLNKFIKEGSK